jgi:hypothetical protein
MGTDPLLDTVGEFRHTSHCPSRAKVEVRYPAPVIGQPLQIEPNRLQQLRVQKNS